MSDTVVDKMQEVVEDKVGGGGSQGIARKLLIPAAAGVGTLAATVAARKAPDVFRDRVLPLLEDKGGDEAAKIGKQAASKLGNQGGILGAVASKATGGGGGGEGDEGGGREKTRRLPIQRWTDVAVPVQDAYEKWTQFEEFPKFMHRVMNVEEEDNHVQWHEKIWFSTREWEGEITDRRENDRIAWKTINGTSHEGVISFHELGTNLTRVLVTVDFHPSGVIEKMASGLRFVKRAVQADLARFKAYCEFGDAEGIEYAQPGELQEADDSSQNGDRGRQRESGSNGGSASQPQAGEQDDEEREQSRQERAGRRDERRAS